MPYTTQIREECCVITYHGNVSRADLFESTTATAEQMGLSKRGCIILDFIDIDGFVFNVPDMLAFSQHYGKLFAHLRNAPLIFVARHADLRPYIRLFEWEVKKSGVNITLFSKRQTAWQFVKQQKYLSKLPDTRK